MHLFTLHDTAKGAISTKTLEKQLLCSWGPVLLLRGFNYQHFYIWMLLQASTQIVETGQLSYNITLHYLVYWKPYLCRVACVQGKANNANIEIAWSVICMIVYVYVLVFFSVLEMKIKSYINLERDRQTVDRWTDEQMLSDRCIRPSLVCGQQIWQAFCIHCVS